MPSISGQTLLVIGGTSGIGFGVAKLAVAEGMKVAIASSKPERVARAVERLKKSSSPDGCEPTVHGYTIDLSQDDVECQLEQLLTGVISDFGGDNSTESLDHLVFTAGDPIEHRPRLYPQKWQDATYAAGLSGATRNLALDLKPIRVNQVNSGPVITELWGEGAEPGTEAVARQAFLGKVGTPEETTEAYIYLMKDTSYGNGNCHQQQ